MAWQRYKLEALLVLVCYRSLAKARRVALFFWLYVLRKRKSVHHYLLNTARRGFD